MTSEINDGEAANDQASPLNVHRSTRRRCDNPSCTHLIAWPEQQRGRPPRFCSDRCRQKAPADLARLQADLQDLQDLELTELSYRQRREVNSRRARTEWLLSAFPRSMPWPGD